MWGGQNRRLRYWLETLALTELLLAVELHSHMEVEMTCSLLLIFGFSLYINAKENRKYRFIKLFLAGCCIGSLFFFKSVLLIMSVSFAAAAVLWNIENEDRINIKKIIPVVIGSFAMLGFGIITILIIYPAELSDMLNASVFQKTLISGGDFSVVHTLGKFGLKFIDAVRRFPFLILGVFATVKNIVGEKSGRLLKNVIHMILWIVPALFVVLSNKYFPYHYYMFSFPAVFEIYLYTEKNEEKTEWKWIAGCIVVSIVVTMIVGIIWDKVSQSIQVGIPFLIALCLVCILIISIKGKTPIGKYAASMVIMLACFVYVMFISGFSRNFSTIVSLRDRVYKNNEFTKSTDFKESVLYLDDGTGAYTLGVKSYLKYFFPLPVQRIADDAEYSDLPCRVDSMEKIESYGGEYVTVYEKWIFEKGKNENIRRKLEDEYEKTGEISKYSPSHELFIQDTEENIETILLYKRR